MNSVSWNIPKVFTSSRRSATRPNIRFFWVLYGEGESVLTVDRTKPVSMALQGGGAHGAFTWGVLDYLLEDGRLEIAAMTAASAGAMNAVAVAQGLMTGGPDGARAQMEQMWQAVSRAGALFNTSRAGPWEKILKGVGVNGAAFLEALVRMSSPYDRNPFNFNPLRDILNKQIDFERLRRESPVELFISATNVRTGKIRVFKTDEVATEAVIASACLPFLFHAVEVDGQHYWDGGYVGNPALFPLLKDTAAKDVVICHINPLERDDVPTTADAIMDRMNEITFNASLLSELRAIALAQKVHQEHWLARGFRSRVRDVLVHSIRADRALTGLSVSSKFNTDMSFLTNLRARGRTTAKDWLNGAYVDIGKRSSVDLRSEYLDHEETAFD